MGTRRQDDFYEAINEEWIAQAVIPNDKSRTGGFIDLADEIEELMLATTDKWLAGDDVPDDQVLQNFIQYHRLASYWQTGNQLGSDPVRPIIERDQQF